MAALRHSPTKEAYAALQARVEALEVDLASQQEESKRRETAAQRELRQLRAAADQRELYIGHQ